MQALGQARDPPNTPTKGAPKPTELDDAIKQEPLQYGMTEAQFKEVLQNLHLLPQDYREGAIKSKIFRVPPFSFFHVSASPRAYTSHNRMVGRYLLGHEPDFLKAVVEKDLARLRHQKDITAKQIRGYFYYKFGLQNRQTARLLGKENMTKALQSIPLKRAPKQHVQTR